MSSDAPIWVSAAATLLASLVALFGPAVRHWWRRPRITLHQPLDTLLLSDELILARDSEDSDDRLQYVLLDVTNHGRSQLDDVEAVLTAYQPFGPPTETREADEYEAPIPAFDLPVVSRGLLQFELAQRDQPRVTIPPGATRVLRLAFLATDRRTRRELLSRHEEIPAQTVETVGAFALWPLPGADRMTWLLNDDSTSIEVAISARNAKACTWSARIRAWSWAGIQDEEYELSGIKLDWENDLRRVRRPGVPTPKRAWIRAHTPRALWQERQFRREMRAIRDTPRPVDDGNRTP